LSLELVAQLHGRSWSGYSQGAFSQIAIGWLERQSQWPEIDTITNDLMSEFEKSNVEPFTFFAREKMLWGGGENLAFIGADLNRWSTPCKS
jgi:hypothetical protein